jgi:hypothetical protein
VCVGSSFREEAHREYRPTVGGQRRLPDDPHALGQRAADPAVDDAGYVGKLRRFLARHGYC